MALALLQIEIVFLLVLIVVFVIVGLLLVVVFIRAAGRDPNSPGSGRETWQQESEGRAPDDRA